MTGALTALALGLLAALWRPSRSGSAALVLAGAVALLAGTLAGGAQGVRAARRVPGPDDPGLPTGTSADHRQPQLIR